MAALEVLASSSAGCCYLLTEGVAPLLIECGLPIKQIQESMWRRGITLSALAGCVISHAHGDHCRGASDLLIAGVDCYASEDTWKTLFIQGHRARPLLPHYSIDIGSWEVKPFEAVHDCKGTLGFVITSEAGDRWLYLTDSAYSHYRFGGLTGIAVEANFSSELLRSNARSGEVHAERYKRTLRTHMSIERLIDMLRSNDLSKCREIHLLHLSDANSDEAHFAEQVRAATGVPTYVAPKAVS